MRGFLQLILATVFGAVFGWISAIGMIENIGLIAVAGNENWKERRADPGETMAPYAIGYFIDQGEVPPPPTARYFVRNADDDGSLLRADCVYLVEGKPVPSRWWTVAVANPQGEGDALSAGDAVIEPDGNLKLFLAPYPVPGNRLTLPPGSPLKLSLTVHEPVEAQGPFVLPSVKKAKC